jgi:hypothetical protein
MRDITHDPFFIRLGERMRGPQGLAVGTVRRIIISNVVCYNSASRTASLIIGVPGHNIEHLNIHDVYIEHQGGGTADMTGVQVPEQETGYPDPGRFGATPSNGFFIRHVKGLAMSNVEIVPQKQDLRPAFQVTDVQGADFFRIKTPHAEDVPMFVLDNVSDFNVGHARPVADTQLEHVDHKTL